MASIRKAKKRLKRELADCRKILAGIDFRPLTLDGLYLADAMFQELDVLKSRLKALTLSRL